MYKVLYHPTVFKFFKKISKKDLQNLVSKIEKVSQNPFVSGNMDIKKLINTSSSYRLRYRNFRIVYQIDQKGKTVYIREIDFRGNIY